MESSSGNYILQVIQIQSQSSKNILMIRRFILLIYDQLTQIQCVIIAVIDV